MQCTNPENYNRNGLYLANVPPCNKCLACCLNRQHEWASRLTLESMAHDEAQFITFTFDPEHLPTDQSQANLKRIWQLFVKKLQKKERQPRYFVCMEFGTKFQRPHFHAIFFGRKTELIRRKAKRSESKTVYVYVDPLIEDTWGLGSTYTKALNSSNMTKSITQYVAGYILKGKWQNTDTKSPRTKSEWALQSRKPYIGSPAVKIFADLYTTAKGARRLADLRTIPNYFYFDKRRYKMPNRIRKEIGQYIGYPVLDLPGEQKTNYTIAKARSNKIAKSIQRRRKLNITKATG